MTEAAELPGPIVRAFKIVSVISEASRPLTHREIAAAVGVPASTTHRLLRMMCSIGLAEVDRAEDEHRYKPGPWLTKIAYGVIGKTDVAAAAPPFVRAIVDEINATTMLWLYFDGSRLMMPGPAVSSSHRLDFRSIGFMPRGLAWGCVGRSVLAHLSDQHVDHAMTAEPVSPTGRQIEPKEELAAELKAIRARGYAISTGHTIQDAVGFASAVFDYRGQPLGCLGCTIPMIRFDPADEARYGDVVRRQAQRLSDTLGYRPTR
ncbi:MAG: helix-turn-helix domain-containing protein [Rhizobiaceae bacterium]|nr:helix-turn-helix domain-containing protein [Rhizobiaceae bacterium]